MDEFKRRDLYELFIRDNLQRLSENTLAKIAENIVEEVVIDIELEDEWTWK